MKRILSLTLGLACYLSVPFLAMGQGQAPMPFKLKIHHADPWFVKAMIEGIPVRSPELSTLPGFAGIVSTGANSAMSLLKSGYLVVNATDNSLWFFPRH